MNDRIIVGKEEKKDYYQTEHMTQRAFWNRYKPGCDEHYLVHCLRKDNAYLPEFSRIALVDERVVGCIMYSRACVFSENKRHDLVTFGPLCVDPDYQGQGIGARLVQETAELAAAAGIPGIIIFGEEDYYPRLGFKTCNHYGITTKDGKNFASFMCYELKEHAMSMIKGAFDLPEIYGKVSEKTADEFNKKFPLMEKLVLPGQWDKWESE